MAATAVEQAIYALSYQTTGVDQLEKGQRAVEGNATAIGKLSVVEEKVDRVRRTTTAGLERMIGTLDKRVRAEQQLQRAIEQVTRYENEGVGSSQRRALALELATRRFQEQTAALGRAAAGHRSFAAANDNTIAGYGRLAGVLAAVQPALFRMGAGGAAGLIGMGAAGGGAAAIVALAAAVTSAGDAWVRYGNQLRTAGVASDDVLGRTRDLSDLALATRAGIEPTIQLYSRMLKATQDLGVSQSEVRRVTEVLSKSFASSGSTAAEAASGLIQFSQGLQSGRFQGDELRSILENLPNMARAIAKEFGVTIGELRDLGAEGKLTAERVLAGIIKSGAETDRAFSQTGVTIEQASTNSVTALQRLGAELNTILGISQGVAAAINGIANGVMSLANAVAMLPGEAELNKINNLRGAVAGIDSEMPFLESVGGSELKRRLDERARALAELEKLTTGRINRQVGILPEVEINANGLVKQAGAAGLAAKAIRDLGTEEEKARVSGMEPLAKAVEQANRGFAERDKLLDKMKVAGVDRATQLQFEARSHALLAKEIGNATAAAEKKSGGSSGSDSFDSAMQRAQDQIDELKLQAEAASKTTFEVYKLNEAHRLRRAAQSAGRADEQGVAEDIERTAEALANQRIATERALEAQRRMQETVRELGQVFTSFVDDLLTGTDGINGALRNLSSGYGKNALDALLTGSGPLAGMMGTAPTEKGQLGGILSPDFFKKMEGAFEGGFEGGWEKAFGFQVTQGPNADGSAGGRKGPGLAAGANAVVGLASAYGAGQQAQSPLMGALGGAVSGFAAGAPFGPVGAGIGAALGAGLGLFGQSQAASDARRQKLREAGERFDQSQPQIESFQAQLRGQTTGGLTAALAQAEQQAAELATLSREAGRGSRASDIEADLVTFRDRVIGEFARSFPAMLDAMREGLGPNSPFVQARDNATALGEALKGFVDDARTAGQNVGEAQAVSRDFALSTIDGARQLSAVEARLAEIQGTAAGLSDVLQKLGMSADEAAEAISERTTKALDELASTFVDGIERKLNEATDRGFLNEFNDLFTETEQAVRDADALGLDTGLIDRYFTAQAQKIVDGAELVGDEFANLIKLFPDLAGVVVEFGTDAVSVARKMAEAMQEAQSFIAGVTLQIETYLNNLVAGPQSPLAPEARLAEAQSQYGAQLTLAQGGDRNALNSITQYASSLIDAGRSFYGSSSDFQTIFASIQNQLEALPGQVTAEELIVSAIEQSTTDLLASLDANGDGFISRQEAANSRLAQIFNTLDADGDGQISKLELIRSATASTQTNTGSANNLLTDVRTLEGQSRDGINGSNSQLDQIKSLNATSRDHLALMREQLTGTVRVGESGLTVENTMLSALNKIVLNTAFNNGKIGAPRVVAMGGWIGGLPHSQGGTMIEAERGEYVIRASEAAKWSGALEDINAGRGLPMLPIPVAANGNGGADNGSMLAELRALRSEVAALRRDNNAVTKGAAAEIVAGNKEALAPMAQSARLAAARSTRAA